MNGLTLDLIARVVAWTEGVRPDAIATVAQEVGYLDAAQQCAEDLGLTGVPTRPAVHAAFCWCDGCQGNIPHPDADIKAEAFQAARDAVAALLGWQHGMAMTAITKADALAAIDALRVTHEHPRVPRLGRRARAHDRGYEQGQRDMLARCIAAVEALFPMPDLPQPIRGEQVIAAIKGDSDE